ncbi:hypothetical protein C2S51_017359 [Perilla frutescens var. frutescens]|nr:hypothetical protein C2S51_017359 [Perilla frutescens var. frutescens]
MNKKGNRCSQGTHDPSEKSIRTRENDATWDLPTITALLEIMYGMLRVLWRKFHDLITKKTGFGWDPLTCTVTASDECWASWIADNPREAKLRYKGPPHYPYCTEMFGSSIATGDLARSSTMSTWDSNKEDNLNTSYPISSGCANGVGGSPLPNERADLEKNINEIPESNSQHTSREMKSTKSNRSSRIDHALDAWASVNSARARKTWLGKLLSGHPDRFQRSLRMNKSVFIALCDLLISRDLIKVSCNTRVGCEESLAIFLGTVGFTTSQRISCERFQHSLETISRHIKRVTKALNKLASELIINPDFTVVHPKILGSPQLFPYFKDCVGAIDGTLVSAWAPARRHNAYRSRKSEISQNVMEICDFNLLFTYVMAGWEGSANDSRVLMDAIKRDPKFPWPPEGKYYLVDLGYCNFPSFLAPYRGTRYHQRAWSGRQAHGPEELFNKRHLSLRNAIERTFGILKGRFPILKGPMHRYCQTRQVQIVIACCVIHNFIRKYFMDVIFFIRGENGEFDPSNEEHDEQHNPPTPGVELHEEYDWVFVTHSQKEILLALYPDAKKFFIKPPQHWQEMKALFSSYGLVYADGKKSTEGLNIAGQTSENPIVLSETSGDKSVGISSSRRRSQMAKGKNVSDNNGKSFQIPDAFSIPWAGTQVSTHESHNGRHNLAGVAIGKEILQPYPLMHRHLIDEPSEESIAASKTPWVEID